MSKFKELLQTGRMQGKKLKKDQLLILLLCGVLLLVIALPVSGKKTVEDTKKTDLFSFQEESGQQEILSGQTIDPGTDGSEAWDEESYAEQMEQKVKALLGTMDQVGRVEVLITLKSSGERIVEKDLPINRSTTSEQDAQGGTRNVNNLDSGENTVYETESGKSTPYVVKTESPQVEGVVVVCEGAGTGEVRKNITEVIEVLFGIEPHKIRVVKMKTT